MFEALARLLNARTCVRYYSHVRELLHFLVDPGFASEVLMMTVAIWPKQGVQAYSELTHSDSSR